MTEDQLKQELDAILWVPGMGQENLYKAMREKIEALLAAQNKEARNTVIEEVLSELPEIPPYPVESKDLQMMHEGAQTGFYDCRTLVKKLLTSKLKPSKSGELESEEETPRDNK